MHLNVESAVAIGNSLSISIMTGAFFVFVVGVISLKGIVGIKYAYMISFVKSMIPLLYFSFFFDSSFHLLSDDLKYLNAALSLGGNIKEIIDAKEWGRLLDLYYTWNFMTSLWFFAAFIVFGYYYWAPIFLSIVFSFFTARQLFFLLRNNIFPGSVVAIVCFYSLHPYVIAWTSFIALRESLAAFLLVVLLRYTFGFLVGSVRLNAKNITVFLLVFVITYNVRYALFYFTAASLVVLIMLHRKAVNREIIYNGYFSGLQLDKLNLLSGKNRVFMVGGILMLILYLFSFSQSDIKFVLSVPFQAVKFLISPLPWKLSEEYLFLLVPASFHVVFFVPSVFIIPGLWKRSLLFRFLLINLVIASLVYALVGLGIRQRFQYEFILILIQFHFLYQFIFYKGDLKDMCSGLLNSISGSLRKA